ncbi:MAG: hypothetical protein ACR2GP_14475 [Burkholderiaceae bacterium]
MNDPSNAPGFGGAPRDGERFFNLYPFKLPTLADLARWYRSWTLAGGTKPPAGGSDAIPVLRPDLAYLRANRSDTTIAWVGHSTLLLQLAGLNVITTRPRRSLRNAVGRLRGRTHHARR